MRVALWIYWFVGCFIWGWFMATEISRCPRDEFPITGNDVAGVVLWPSFIVGAVIVEKDKLGYRKCRTEQ